MVLAATLSDARQWLKAPNALQATYSIFADAMRTLNDALLSSTWQRVLILAPSDAACLSAGILSGAYWASLDPAAVLSLFVVLPECWPNVDPGYQTLQTLNQGFQISLLVTKAGFIVPGGGCINDYCSPVIEVPKSLSCGIAALLRRDALLDPTYLPSTTVAASLDAALPTAKYFQQWLFSTGLILTLQGQGDVTVFAPTDAALQNLAAYFNTSVEGLFSGPLAFTQGYYLVPGKLPICTRATASDSFELSLTFDACSNLLYVNNAAVYGTPTKTANGTLYLINDVLLHGNSGPQPTQVTARRGLSGCGGARVDVDTTITPAIPITLASNAVPL